MKIKKMILDIGYLWYKSFDNGYILPVLKNLDVKIRYLYYFLFITLLNFAVYLLNNVFHGLYQDLYEKNYTLFFTIYLIVQGIVFLFSMPVLIYELLYDLDIKIYKYKKYNLFSVFTKALVYFYFIIIVMALLKFNLFLLSTYVLFVYALKKILIQRSYFSIR